MTASDFIGKTVYAPDGTSIGEVNDFFVTNDGKVQAVVVGVGGFLGIGEKNVAVSMPSIQMQPDGENTKLVINATKEELTDAPTYDREKRVTSSNRDCWFKRGRPRPPFFIFRFDLNRSSVFQRLGARRCPNKPVARDGRWLAEKTLAVLNAAAFRIACSKIKPRQPRK